MSQIKYLQHWRTTLAGLAMILSAVAHIHSVADVSRTEVLGELAGGIGLIAAPDAPTKKDQ